VTDPGQCQPAYSHRSSLCGDTVLVYSYDPATLQVIRDFLEPLGFNVEVAPASDLSSVTTD
jgi:hypothetical protein